MKPLAPDYKRALYYALGLHAAIVVGMLFQLDFPWENKKPAISYAVQNVEIVQAHTVPQAALDAQNKRIADEKRKKEQEALRIAQEKKKKEEAARLAELEKKKKGTGGEIQLTDALQSMLSTHPFHGSFFEGERFDCGTKAGFLEAVISLSLKREDLKNIVLKTLEKLERTENQ